ncbi:hypothetical protein P3T76_003207 [Phytophthora citrophthora]|uniref:Uncharacterized protein n=1 Tax=Phytophthora citrophthora TaxID=4793 RepID=A0AAD9GX09_9STRA|nr:hypothetical protein P3T76_003207 [Phytophthora citrophthora]
MGDHEESSASSSERNPSSPAAMSGIDWSIFKDSEEDTFGWLLRNNAMNSSTTSSAMAASAAGNLTSDILPLDDIDMDRMMAGASAVSQQALAKGPAAATSLVTAINAQPPLGATQSNARLLAAQLYEGLRSSPTKPTANLLSMLPNVPSFDNDTLSMDGSYDDFDAENDHDVGKPPPKGIGGRKREKNASVVQDVEEKAPSTPRNTRAKSKANTTSTVKSNRPLKRKKRPSVTNCSWIWGRRGP